MKTIQEIDKRITIIEKRIITENMKKSDNIKITLAHLIRAHDDKLISEVINEEFPDHIHSFTAILTKLLVLK